MYILAFILMFTVGSICAAFEGDYSGLWAILQVVLYIVVFVFLALVLSNSVATVITYGIVAAILVKSLKKK